MSAFARIIKDSIAPSNVRLTTFVLKYPRFIHSEVMTHRSFSRNASSSRARPFNKVRSEIIHDMAMPLDFHENKSGMQGGKKIVGWKEEACFFVWWLAGIFSVFFSTILNWLGAHKQYVNRISEPFSFITVIVTGTDEAFANFFALRAHPAAQPEIQHLAYIMLNEYRKSEPERLAYGEWHLPFVDTPKGVIIEDWRPYIIQSVARCARVSYLNHDGTNPDYDKDKALYDRLLGSSPIHASPAEHQAMAVANTNQSGNFHGWVQYRKTLPNEFINKMEV